MWTPLIPNWWLTDNLPHKTYGLPVALSMTEPNRKAAGRGESRDALGLWKPLPGSLLVEDGLGTQLSPPTCTKFQQRQPPTMVNFVALNRHPRGGPRQHLVLTCTRVSFRRPQHKHIQWAVSHHIRARLIGSNSGYLKKDLGRSHTLMGQNPICPISLHTATHTLWLGSSFTVSQSEGQPQVWQTRSNHKLTTTKNWYNPYKGHSWST